MAELSPEFIATAKRMGVPLPPRHRPRFFSSVRSYFRFRIDWTGPLTNDLRALADIELSNALRCYPVRWLVGMPWPWEPERSVVLVAGFDEDGSPIFTDP